MFAVLGDMLSYCRPHGSIAERQFIDRYISPLPRAEEDRYGNWHVLIGESVRVLYSCHIDTVHRRSGRQDVQISGNRLQLPKRERKRQSCLGADDTVGVYLCREMILAGKPGYYVFHYGEESGCIGSDSIATYAPEWLEDVQIAIALDRAGTADVISHQCNTRTASNAFCWALADQLNAMIPSFRYAPSPHGVYTDTERYAALIPECTNLSVGYYRQHSTSEYVDASHVARLRKALLGLNADVLPVTRNPRVTETRTTGVRWKDWPESWEDTERRIDQGSIYLDPDYADVMTSEEIETFNRWWREWKRPTSKR